MVLVPPIYAADEQHFARLPGLHRGLELDRQLPTRVFAALAAEHGLHLLDLLPALSERYRQAEDLSCHRLDRHWSPAGLRLATEQLIEFPRSERLLPVAAETDSRE